LADRPYGLLGGSIGGPAVDRCSSKWEGGAALARRTAPFDMLRDVAVPVVSAAALHAEGRRSLLAAGGAAALECGRRGRGECGWQRRGRTFSFNRVTGLRKRRKCEHCMMPV
jgi:hypothetical protein